MGAALLLLTAPLLLRAQSQAIGQWRAHLPYNAPSVVATDGQTCYVGAGQGFFTYNDPTGEVVTYSKAEGMHDVGVAQIAYEPQSKTAVIAYTNSNIDLFHDGLFYNIPDIRLKNTTLSKAINALYADDGLVYAATDLGIVVINPEREEVKETYVFNKAGQTLAIRAVARLGANLYAATPQGLYRAPANAPNLQDFAAWTSVDSTRDLRWLAVTGDRLFGADGHTAFVLNADTLQVLRPLTDPKGFDANNGRLYISDYADDRDKILIGNSTGQFIDSFYTPLSLETVGLDNGAVAVADAFARFGIRYSGTEVKRVLPPGPNDYITWDILANDGDVWVAHGALNDLLDPTNRQLGLSHRSKDDRWTIYDRNTSPLFRDSTLRDLISLARDPSDGSIWAGSYWWGLLHLNPATGEGEILRTAQGLDRATNTSATNAVTVWGMAFDDAQNLWVTQHGTPREVGVRLKDDGSWRHYAVQASRGYAYSAGALLIDDAGQKWYTIPRGGGGVICYNDGGTPAVGSDDQYRQLGQGEGNGGLPTNIANCLAKDRDGAIWIGTTSGIGVVSCAAQVIARQCEATRPIVQYDQFAGYLFDNENVTALAVDGANRKWVGTGNGVWLVSPSGDQVIYRFTTDNSPLPVNAIRKITVDAVTGDVYFGTDAGMVSFRSTATQGTDAGKITEALVFPNPVPPGFGGSIAIRGLGTDADVRITDVAGQLIYRTRALGGQAVWNGLDYTGRRPQSGVYLIYAAGSAGQQKYVGKLIFAE